jgi:hypothetical protein
MISASASSLMKRPLLRQLRPFKIFHQGDTTATPAESASVPFLKKM